MCLFEGMRLIASSKTRKEICAYEKVCAYKEGALDNPSRRYTVLNTQQSEPQLTNLKVHMGACGFISRQSALIAWHNTLKS